MYTVFYTSLTIYNFSNKQQNLPSKDNSESSQPVSGTQKLTSASTVTNYLFRQDDSSCFSNFYI